MEKILEIEAFKVRGKDALISVDIGGSPVDITAVLTDVIIKINDSLDESGKYTVRNAFWLTLNQCICDTLKERSLKK